MRSESSASFRVIRVAVSLAPAKRTTAEDADGRGTLRSIRRA